MHAVPLTDSQRRAQEGPPLVGTFPGTLKLTHADLVAHLNGEPVGSVLALSTCRAGLEVWGKSYPRSADLLPGRPRSLPVQAGDKVDIRSSSAGTVKVWAVP